MYTLRLPPNLRFEIDDAEADWTYTSKFDFIRLRAMGGSFKDARKVLQQSLNHLSPGGWIEWKEFETVTRTNDDTFPSESAYLQVMTNLNQAVENFGKPMNIAPTLKSLMESSGFTNVSEQLYKVVLLKTLTLANG